VAGVSQTEKSERLCLHRICPIRVPAHTGDRLAFWNSHSCIYRGLPMGDFCLDCGKVVYRVQVSTLRKLILRGLEMVWDTTPWSADVFIANCR